MLWLIYYVCMRCPAGSKQCNRSWMMLNLILSPIIASVVPEIRLVIVCSLDLMWMIVSTPRGSFNITSPTNLPSGDSNADYLFSGYCETRTGAAKSIDISYYDFWQEL